mgnify:CR=1 FL=1
MFRGNAPARIDEKGRLKVPTAFKTLLMLFLGIEIISIPLYILAGSDKRNLKSNEAALKYFLMGSFSTGLMLMGIALLYGSSGTFFVDGLNLGMGKLAPMVAIGLVLLVWFDIAGHTGMGAQRWIALGPITIQPSDVMKVALVLVLAQTVPMLHLLNRQLLMPMWFS